MYFFGGDLILCQCWQMLAGHVKPQSEYFAPFSSTCGLPIDFVGSLDLEEMILKGSQKESTEKSTEIP